ncbi:MAG TPA: hypothetical protein PKC43_03460 [Phycisphaerales bacterium]|nr:hypothetical protein [Phycisphaerales bacterium]HMP36487.1 hypothetical protein [Phycisphaerales bacterium]
MQGSLVRIILALLVGVWSPLCCCQAMALVGRACERGALRGAEAAGCCSRCAADDGVPASQDDAAPTRPADQLPGGCDSCPACLGAIGIAVKLESLTMIPDAGSDERASVDPRPSPRQRIRRDDAGSLSGPRPSQSLRANRPALRWHCTLIV